MDTSINIQNDAFPIRTVSALTGINAVTLRTWERRYHLIEPIRTPKGHRLYTKEQIAMLHRVVTLLEGGMAISQINFSHLEGNSNALNQEQEFWSRLISRMVSAVSQFNEAVLEATYNEALSLYPIEVVTGKLLMPMLKILGERWESGAGSIAEEHFFGVYLRNKLGARFHHRKRLDHGPTLITACLPGEYHEAGILMFSLSAYDHGYRCILLGADMPLEELPNAVNVTQAQAIVLSGSNPQDVELLKNKLAKLVRQVRTPVFIGGQASINNTARIHEVGAFALGQEIEQSFRFIAATLKDQFANGIKPVHKHAAS